MWYSRYKAHKDRLVAQVFPYYLLAVLLIFLGMVVYPLSCAGGGSMHPALWQHDLRICEHDKDNWKSVIACMRARGWQSAKQEWWE